MTVFLVSALAWESCLFFIFNSFYWYRGQGIVHNPYPIERFYMTEERNKDEQFTLLVVGVRHRTVLCRRALLVLCVFLSFELGQFLLTTTLLGLSNLLLDGKGIVCFLALNSFLTPHFSGLQVTSMIGVDLFSGLPE